MKVTPDNLVNQDELINLADISWTISEAIGSVIDSMIEQTFDYWEEESGRKESFNDWMTYNDLDVVQELKIDWDKAMEIGLTELLNMLNELSHDELNDAFEVDFHPNHKPGVSGGYSLDQLPALLTVDEDKVMELWGDRSIDDGRNTSGFIRTCDDRYWTTAQVLRTLIHEADEEAYNTFYCRLYETYELEEAINYGRLVNYYDEAMGAE